ncbi:hypothetical protein BGZ90_007575, partial [Linnemannia elongata]
LTFVNSFTTRILDEVRPTFQGRGGSPVVSDLEDPKKDKSQRRLGRDWSLEGARTGISKRPLIDLGTELKDLETSQGEKRKRWLGTEQERYELTVLERKMPNTGSPQSSLRNASKSIEQHESYQNLCDAKQRADSYYLDWVKDEEHLRAGAASGQECPPKDRQNAPEHHPTQHYPTSVTSWVSNYMDQPMRGKQDRVHANRLPIGRSLSNGFQHHSIASWDRTSRPSSELVRTLLQSPASSEPASPIQQLILPTRYGCTETVITNETIQNHGDDADTVFIGRSEHQQREYLLQALYARDQLPRCCQACSMSTRSMHICPRMQIRWDVLQMFYIKEQQEEDLKRAVLHVTFGRSGLRVARLQEIPHLVKAAERGRLWGGY